MNKEKIEINSARAGKAIYDTLTKRSKEYEEPNIFILASLCAGLVCLGYERIGSEVSSIDEYIDMIGKTVKFNLTSMLKVGDEQTKQ